MEWSWWCWSYGEKVVEVRRLNDGVMAVIAVF